MYIYVIYIYMYASHIGGNGKYNGNYYVGANQQLRQAAAADECSEVRMGKLCMIESCQGCRDDIL